MFEYGDSPSADTSSCSPYLAEPVTRTSFILKNMNTAAAMIKSTTKAIMHTAKVRLIAIFLALLSR